MERLGRKIFIYGISEGRTLCKSEGVKGTSGCLHDGKAGLRQNQSLGGAKRLYKNRLYQVFYVLHHKLPEPWEGTVVPALGVKGEKDVGRQVVAVGGTDDVEGGG